MNVILAFLKIAAIFHTMQYYAKNHLFYLINDIFTDHVILHSIEHLECFWELSLFPNYVENAISHKFIVQDVRSMFRAILEIAGNSSLTPRQSHSTVFYEIQLSNSSWNFKYQTF